MQKLLFVSFLFVFIVGCQGQKTNTKSDTSQEESLNSQVRFEDLQVEDFMKRYQSENQALLLDVRTPEETAEGKIEGAKEIDFYSSNFEAQIQSLDRQTPTYIYCRSGGRSAKAASLMKELGFEKVYNLDGGYNAYSEQ